MLEGSDVQDMYLRFITAELSMAVHKTPSQIGNLISQLPTMFWILNSENFALNPMCAYLHDASCELSSYLVPITTIFPNARIKCSCFGVASTNDDGGKTLWQIKVAHMLAVAD